MPRITRTKPHPDSYAPHLPLRSAIKEYTSARWTRRIRVKKELFALTAEDRARLANRPLVFRAHGEN